MTYKELIEYNKRNISNNVDKFRIEKALNDGKTCMLKSSRFKNTNPSLIDIAHIVSEIRLGRIAITNPSKIRNWKYFTKE